MERAGRKFRMEDEAGVEILEVPQCELCGEETMEEKVQVGKRFVRVCMECRTSLGAPRFGISPLEKSWEWAGMAPPAPKTQPEPYAMGRMVYYPPVTLPTSNIYKITSNGVLNGTTVTLTTTTCY